MRHLRRIRRHLDLDTGNYLHLLLGPVVSIIAIHFCTVLPTLNSQGFTRVQNRLARLVTKSPPFTCSIPLLRSLHWLPVRFRMLFMINLLTYKSLYYKQPVYLYSMLAASLPSHSLRSNNDNSLSVARFKTNTGARAFLSGTPSLWNNLPLSVRSAISVATFKNQYWRHISWSFPHRYRHTWWPVDVTELFLRFCCWTLIWLSRHWAWLCRDIGAIETWFIDWLIDWLIDWNVSAPSFLNFFTLRLPCLPRIMFTSSLPESFNKESAFDWC